MTTKLLLFVKRSEDINRGMLACLPGAIKQYATGFGWPQTVASDSSRLCRSLLENEWATWLLTNCSFLKEWKRLFYLFELFPAEGLLQFFLHVVPWSTKNCLKCCIQTYHYLTLHQSFLRQWKPSRIQKAKDWLGASLYIVLKFNHVSVYNKWRIYKQTYREIQ